MSKPLYHIVLVEDDDAHAELVNESFKMHPQFRLTKLDRLKTAQDFLKNTQPDLLFSDLVLPDGRGIDLIPDAGDMAAYPAVLMTSYGDEQTAVEVMKSGAFDYLTKSEQLFYEMPRVAERVLREWQEIVKRREAEVALRRSEEHLRMALESAKAGTWEWDFQEGCFTHSEGLENFFQLPFKSKRFRLSQYLELVGPDDRELVKEILNQALSENPPYQQEPFQVEHRTLGPAGEERWLSVQGKVIRDEQDDLLRIAGTIVDITARKESEAKLRNMEDHLAHVSRVSTMGEMISGIAHELNQPLYAIQNYGKASLNLLAQGREANSDQIREWLEEITTTATHAGEVLTRHRDFVRKSPSERTSVDVQEVVRSATDMVRHESRKQSIAVRNIVSLELPKVSIDAVQIEQVLVNLLRNSFEALELSNRNGRALVRISAELIDGKLEVTVFDNGPGLPNEAAKVFDAFSTTKPNGMGLGLAIARTIVESHGGKLWATSNQEEGVSFHFTLPIGKRSGLC